jgi:hypothetical protein
MPSWMPGDDYYTNFRVGDPYVKVDQGFARLPGEGYAALHPELDGVNPEDYPDIHKLAILADVAPYSREYNTIRQRVGSAAQGNTELEIEYGKILDRVRKTKDSGIRMDDRRFTAAVDEIEGTVEYASPSGITVKEFPGPKFGFSSVGMKVADISERILASRTRDFHLFVLFGTIENHYRLHMNSAYIYIDNNSLHRRCPRHICSLFAETVIDPLFAVRPSPKLRHSLLSAAIKTASLRL